MDDAARFQAAVRGGVPVRVGALAVALAVAVAACTGQPTPVPSASASPSVTSAAPATPPPSATPAASSPPTASPTPRGTAPPSGPLADVIYRDANIITMDERRPRAQAVAVRGDRILAVGGNAEIAGLRGPGTVVVTLAGRTIVPGFIDSHQHRIGDGPTRLGLASPVPLIDAAIEQGWTTIAELYVDQPRLDELRGLDLGGALRLRVNAYLPVQENSPEGILLGDYFAAYRPGQMVSPHVRVAGLKVFTDFDNAKILLWKQPDLDAFLLERHREGWPLAVKTVSTRSLAMIVKAFQAIRAADARVVEARGRLEHMLFATPGQIEAIEELGLVPAINLNVPGELVGQPDIDELIDREPRGTYAPWRSLFDAAIPAAGITGFPSLYVDEPTGAPFGSPIHLIYQAVTRVGNLGQRSPEALLDQAITAEDALRALSINAARASFEEDLKGSLAAGKLADLVILSADPLAVPAEEINGIEVLVTMIGGKVESCSPGSERLCPGTAGVGPTATASRALPDSPPSNALDGDLETIWSAGSHPEQWIQVDLGAARTLEALRLVISQYPAGRTVHQVWAGRTEANLRLVHTFRGQTDDGQELGYAPATSVAGVRYVRIVTTESPSWVAWREVEITAR